MYRFAGPRIATPTGFRDAIRSCRFWAVAQRGDAQPFGEDLSDAWSRSTPLRSGMPRKPIFSPARCPAESAARSGIASATSMSPARCCTQSVLCITPFRSRARLGHEHRDRPFRASSRGREWRRFGRAELSLRRKQRGIRRTQLPAHGRDRTRERLPPGTEGNDLVYASSFVSPGTGAQAAAIASCRDRPFLERAK